MSDIHNEFYRYEYEKNRSNYNKYQITPQPTDNETTLVLAGDIDVDKHVFASLKHYAKQFKYVVYTPGNHDYWNANISKFVDKLNQQLKEANILNVFILDGSFIILEDVTFVGGTLWTDFGKEDPLSMYSAPNTMNDYRKITMGEFYSKLRPAHLLAEHYRVRNFIKDIALNNPDKLVVVTHHAPSFNSMDDMFSHDKIGNNFYYSELTELFEIDAITHWIHGHSHCAIDYMINGTNVMCNPKGYIGEGETGFNEYANFII